MASDTGCAHYGWFRRQSQRRIAILVSSRYGALTKQLLSFMFYLSPKENYKLFLESEFWKRIRVECFRRDDWKCRHCGIGSSGRLQAHHVIYPDDWYTTTVHMLLTLCRKCHSKTHQPPKPKESTEPQRQMEGKAVRWWPGIYEGRPSPRSVAIPKGVHQQQLKDAKRRRKEENYIAAQNYHKNKQAWNTNPKISAHY